MLFAVLLSLAVAQECKPDVLVDDFATIDQHDYQGALRYFNKLGGDYGAVGIDAKYEPENKRVALTANAAQNFWFTKFDLRACFDLTGYKAIQFDIVAPAGTEASFTLTQKAADCDARLIDSKYNDLKNYITPNGQVQTVTLPLDDFKTNINGGAFDMVHLKDWTLTSLKPLGSTIYISNYVLKGNCASSQTTTVATGNSTAATATSTKVANGTVAATTTSTTTTGAVIATKTSDAVALKAYAALMFLMLNLL